MWPMNSIMNVTPNKITMGRYALYFLNEKPPTTHPVTSITE